MKNFKFLGIGTVLLTFLLPVNTSAVTYIIISDSNWEVYDSQDKLLGMAQNVCLNATAPTNCPPGATLYGYAPSGWSANLSSMPSATWIWAPNISGATSPAANAEFTFKKMLIICGNPVSGTISIAADNFAEVRINGTLVLTYSSHDMLSSPFIIPLALLKSKPLFNVYQIDIEIKVKNGLNPDDCESDQYKCNPAGMVFGATFTDDLPELQKCGNNKHEDFETRNCKDEDGRSGKQSRQCLCGYWMPWSKCIAPPPPPCQLAIVSATPSVCSPSTNTYTLDVNVTYSNAPSGGIMINGRNFSPNGSGSETFTLTGLTANGLVGATVNASFAVNASCSSSSTYNAPAPCTPPPPQCLGEDGTTRYDIGNTETISCDCQGNQGSRTRICQSDGSWGQYSDCTLPPANAGEWCGDKYLGECRTCPPGTTCVTPEPSPCPPKPSFWRCFITGWKADGCVCERIQTSMMVCLPTKVE